MQDLLTVFNLSENKEDFGYAVRILRTRRNESLRDLARKAGFSHAHVRKIETGSTAIGRDVFTRLSRVLDLDLTFDEEEKATFKDLEERLEYAFLYLDHDATERLYKQLQDPRDIHGHSLWMTDYMVVMLGCAYLGRTGSPEDADSLVGELTSVAALFPPEKKQKFHVYRGAHYYHWNHFDEAIEDYRQAIDLAVNRSHTALAHLLLARTYNETGHLTESSHHIEKARDMFEKDQNVLRVSECDAVEISNMIKAGIRVGVEERLEKIVATAHRYGYTALESFLETAWALYHYFGKDYDKALERLDKAKDDTTRGHYFRALLLLKQKGPQAALSHIESLPRESDKTGRFDMYEKGISFMRVYAEKGLAESKKELEMFFETAWEQMAPVTADVAYSYYIRLLKEKRRYKEAYEATKKMITMTKRSLA